MLTGEYYLQKRQKQSPQVFDIFLFLCLRKKMIIVHCSNNAVFNLAFGRIKIGFYFFLVALTIPIDAFNSL